MELTDLIAAAPWREAVTYLETWPHEYVLLNRDEERTLVEDVCRRKCEGEAFVGSFLAAGRCTCSSEDTNTGS